MFVKQKLIPFSKNIKTYLQNKKLYLLTDSRIYRENDGN